MPPPDAPQDEIDAHLQQLLNYDHDKKKDKDYWLGVWELYRLGRPGLLIVGPNE